MNIRSHFFLLILIMCLSVTTMVAQELQENSREHIEALRKSEMVRAMALAKHAAYPSASAENYDVTFYDLNVKVLPGTTSFSGRVEMRFRSLVDGLNAIQYDFGSVGTVDSIFVDGVPASFTHALDIIQVTLPTTLNTNEAASITTVYSFSYANSAILVTSINNVEKNISSPSIATQAEPYDARNWWPCKDDTDDKADSVNITITTDTALFAVSNGLLQSDISNGDGTHTILWHSRYPIVTYLVSIALGNFSVNETTWNYNTESMPVTHWYMSISKAVSDVMDNAMLQGLTIYSDLFGTYPFVKEKYGMAEYSWGGAMEHQTVTSMGYYNVDVVVHELMHQWFGDKVTCATFEHIWLNEGWATYGEALYYEFSGNKSQAHTLMTAAAYYGEGTIFVNDPENSGFSRIFSGNLSYNKASWVVHMLRGIVGDSAFFRATRKYLGDSSLDNYRSVITSEFQQYYEDESGMDLDYFFNEWIYGEYYPTYKYGFTNSLEGSTYKTTVSIEQQYIPSRQVFSMPIQLTFLFADHDTTITVWNDTEISSYEFEFPEEVVNIALDKDDWILKQVIFESRPLTNNDFEHAVLLVNGVDWDVSSYTTPIKEAYTDSTFTGSHPYVFYDLFPFPVAGYPENIVNKYGSAALPLEELQKFCTVVWIGNLYNNDQEVWEATPIYSYIQNGGNVVLLTRMGENFIDDDMQSFLGITWTNPSPSTITNCTAAYPGLMDMPFTGTQTYCAAFNTTLSGTNSELLFTDNVSFGTPVGIGVWGKPRETEFGMSGNFIYLGMRPYRVDRTTLKENIDMLLNNFVCESGTGVTDIPEAASHLIAESYPNPVSLDGDGLVTIAYTLPENAYGYATLQVFDQLGRLVAEPLRGSASGGASSVTLDIHNFAPGVYMYRLTANGVSANGKFSVTR